MRISGFAFALLIGPGCAGPAANAPAANAPEVSQALAGCVRSAVDRLSCDDNRTQLNVVQHLQDMDAAQTEALFMRTMGTTLGGDATLVGEVDGARVFRVRVAGADTAEIWARPSSAEAPATVFCTAVLAEAARCGERLKALSVTPLSALAPPPNVPDALAADQVPPGCVRDPATVGAARQVWSCPEDVTLHVLVTQDAETALRETARSMQGGVGAESVACLINGQPSSCTRSTSANLYIVIGATRDLFIMCSTERPGVKVTPAACGPLLTDAP